MQQPTFLFCNFLQKGLAKNSVDEIYEITGSKNKRFKKIYTEIDRMFVDPIKRFLPFKPQVIITEDSGSGNQFFKRIADRLGIMCESAGGKSRVLECMNRYPDKDVVVIADGAAFGSEIGDIAKQQSLRPRKIAIYLPESFEWVILSSGVVAIDDVVKISNPELFADSMDYMSWEQYFTELLEELTKGSDFVRYSKGKLPDYYNQEKIEKEITETIKGIDFS